LNARSARNVAGISAKWRSSSTNPRLCHTFENTCAKHSNRYHVCHWFAFWAWHDPRLSAILTIKHNYVGYGKASLVDYRATVERIGKLREANEEAADDAFVILELTFVRGDTE
jgi:hypothetical protein